MRTFLILFGLALSTNVFAFDSAIGIDAIETAERKTVLCLVPNLAGDSSSAIAGMLTLGDQRADGSRAVSGSLAIGLNTTKGAPGSFWPRLPIEGQMGSNFGMEFALLRAPGNEIIKFIFIDFVRPDGSYIATQDGKFAPSNCVL